MNQIKRGLATAALTAALALLLAGIAAGRANSHAAASYAKWPQFKTHAKMVVKSDDQHGKKGPDGKWHDAFRPGSFQVQVGKRIKITVLNYDDMPHTFTAPRLHLNKFVPAAKGGKPSKTTFTLTARKAGKYEWWCATPCDPWAMSHDGYMRGYVKAVA
jgi:plastocyanin